MRKNKNKNLSSDETKKVPSVPPAGGLAEAVQKSEEKTDIDAPSDKALQGGEGAEREISETPETSSVEEREASTEAEKGAKPEEQSESETPAETEEAPEAEPKKKSLFARVKKTLLRWKNALFAAVDERTTEVKHAKGKRIAVGVGLGVIVVFFIVFYFTVGKKIAFLIQNPEGFKEWLNGFGDSAKGVAIFIFLRVVQTVLKLIPGEALEIAAGCTFGVWYGLLWCSVGSIIGSLIIVFLGKRYGMKIVGLFVSPEKMQSISFLKNKKRLNVTFFLLYFIPGTPKDMFTWLVCLTDENIFLFILLTAVARIPSIVTSTWCGQELVEENYLLSFGILGGTILLGIIGGIIYKLVLNRNKKKAAANGVSGGGQTEEMS